MHVGTQDVDTLLSAYADMADDALPLAEIALLLSLYRSPELDLAPYRQHLKDLSGEIIALAEKARLLDLPDTGETRLSLLQRCLHDRFSYDGDSNDYDNLDNASLVRVIDRKCGLPIALTILYAHTAKAAGWEVAGLNFPGHVYARLDAGNQRVIFDPFAQGAEVQAHDLRQAVKRLFGSHAELSTQYYEPMSNRDMLIRLQNNIKIRLLEKGDEAAALRVVNGMRLFAPQEHRLLLDAGVLYARAGERKLAGDLLEEYLATLHQPDERAEIIGLLRSLHETLN